MKKEQKVSSEEIGSVYVARPLLGRSPDERQRHQTNDYGKSPAPEAEYGRGIFSSPTRTMRSPV
jgi:hypothetical protein